MKTAIAILLLIQTGTFARADNRSEREKLEGTWVQQGDAASGWVISNVPEGLHLEQNENGRPVASFVCNTSGRDCETKIDGHKAVVSMYYNGAALVTLQTQKGKVVKRRFSAMPTGDVMKVEVIPITDRGQTEELLFNRQNATEAHK
jgi:hypothetical protein